VYIREREFLAVFSLRRRSRRVTSGLPTENADRHPRLLSLRLWAAASTAPLRRWVPPATSNTDNNMVSSTDKDEDYQKGMPAEREAVTEAVNATTRNGVMDWVASDSKDDDQERVPAAREAVARCCDSQ
jgi:hypothetical protein